MRQTAEGHRALCRVRIWSHMSGNRCRRESGKLGVSKGYNGKAHGEDTINYRQLVRLLHRFWALLTLPKDLSKRATTKKVTKASENVTKHESSNRTPFLTFWGLLKVGLSDGETLRRRPWPGFCPGYHNSILGMVSEASEFVSVFGHLVTHGSPWVAEGSLSVL